MGLEIGFQCAVNIRNPDIQKRDLSENQIHMYVNEKPHVRQKLEHYFFQFVQISDKWGFGFQGDLTLEKSGFQTLNLS